MPSAPAGLAMPRKSAMTAHARLAPPPLPNALHGWPCHDGNERAAAPLPACGRAIVFGVMHGSNAAADTPLPARKSAPTSPTRGEVSPVAPSRAPWLLSLVAGDRTCHALGVFPPPLWG